jgi:hypothetical protein
MCAGLIAALLLTVLLDSAAPGHDPTVRTGPR